MSDYYLCLLFVCVYRERSESHNAKLQRKLEKMNSETEYTLQESKSTLEALDQAREINQKVGYTLLVYICVAFIVCPSVCLFGTCYKHQTKAYKRPK